MSHFKTLISKNTVSQKISRLRLRKSSKLRNKPRFVSKRNKTVTLLQGLQTIATTSQRNLLGAHKIISSPPSTAIFTTRPNDSTHKTTSKDTSPMKANTRNKVFTTLLQTLPSKTETRLRLASRRQAITVLATPLKWPSSTTSRRRAQSFQTLRTRSNTEITWMPKSRSSLSM